MSKELYCRCEVCDKDIYEDEEVYETSTFKVDGLGLAVGREIHTQACKPCGEILSDAIGIARATIVKQKMIQS